MPTINYKPPPASLPPGSTVWAYLRDSGGPSQGESIGRQRSEVQGYCTRYSLLLVKVFDDEAESGKTTAGRDDFDELISASAKPGHPTGLLLWDFARFSRSLDDAGYYKAVLRRNGLVIHSITDDIPEGPYSRIVEMIIDIGNEEKTRQVRRDVLSGLRRIVETYDAMPGTPPAGYMREPINVGKRRNGMAHILHRWVPDPDKAPLVLKAFEMRAAGSTLDQIHTALSLFSRVDGLGTFFSNTIYKGERYFSGKYYPCEPIVTPELWEAVQRLGELRSRGRYGPHSRRCVGSSFLLSGFGYCQECGAPLFGYDVPPAHRYYICSRARRREKCPPARYIPAALLEASVVARVIEDILPLENLLRVQSALQIEWKERSKALDRERKTGRHKLETVYKKIGNLTAAIGDAGATRALLESLKQAEQERDQLEYDLGHAVTEPASLTIPVPTLEALAAKIRAQLLSDDLPERKSALRMLIKRILVRRTDFEIQALIEYQFPEENISSQNVGGFSNNAGAPEGAPAISLIIPISKNHLQPK